MKPTVIANANANASAGAGAGGVPNGVTIPINHEYSGGPQAPQPQSQHPQYYSQGQHHVGGDPHATAYGSPGSHARVQQPQPRPHPQQQQQQQIPAHFQDFDFDQDMFPRSRLGRMAHDPFAEFGATHFGFPQFNSLGRRRANNPHHDDDFFNRLPSEFRQYIPEGFGHRRAGPAASMAGSPGAQAQQMPHFYHTMPQSPSKKVCDAAIQTEDPNASGQSTVDHAAYPDSLNQHGLRNTMDMGIKSALEAEEPGFRSHSAPPPEQQQQQQPQQPQQQYHQQQQQPIPVNGQRPTPPPAQQAPGGRPQFGTQTSPQVQAGGFAGHGPQFQKAYYAPQQSAHPQQKQQTPPPPQTPGGTYIRTIPIFVEGRSEPIINNKEIPNQNAPAASTAGHDFSSPKQQQQQQQQHQPQQQAQQPQPQQPHPHARPTPLNTQNLQPQQQQQASDGVPPQTPHTVDSINKIQDIQRDVLELMTRVEQFTGTRADKDYVYLDEMLTRNLLKLDNIDTNGKESIRLARKEAIKCIQASINVLEAKAEENAKAAQAGSGGSAAPEPVANASTPADTAPQGEEPSPQKSASGQKVTKDASKNQVADAAGSHEPIPLPPPEGMAANDSAALEAAAPVTKAEADQPSNEGAASEAATSEVPTTDIASSDAAALAPAGAAK